MVLSGSSSRADMSRMLSCKPAHLCADDASRVLLIPSGGSSSQETEVGSREGCQEEGDTVFPGGLGCFWRSHPPYLRDGIMGLASPQIRDRRGIFGVSSLKCHILLVTLSWICLPVTPLPTPLISIPTTWVQAFITYGIYIVIIYPS